MPQVRRRRVPDKRTRLRIVIFGVNTRPGKAFDVVLLWTILISVAVVLLESVEAIEAAYGLPLRIAEFVFTFLFTVEYGLRLWTTRNRLAYALSFFGIVDLLSILPTYLSLLVSGSQSLMLVRAFRLLRVFRVLKLVRHITEAHRLMRALSASRPKIVVFLAGVMSVAFIFGTVMYLIEGDAAGFTSIPTSIYWSVVTMTTVGYGDIAPKTPLGQLLAVCLMILGYAIIAVPTGIVSAEMIRSGRQVEMARACPECSHRGHERTAVFCSRCGARLPDPADQRRRG